MSTSVYYRVPRDGIFIGGTSSFWKALQETLDGEGLSTIRINSSSFASLHGLRAGLEMDSEKALVTKLMDAIEEFKEIEVFAQY